MNPLLDPEKRHVDIVKLEKTLKSKVIAQDAACESVVEAIQVYFTGLCSPKNPVASFLFVGPTGVGKTLVAESLAEVLHGHPRAMLRVDCAEFSHSHDISRLLGSPPGYIGHKETEPYFSPQNLRRYVRDEMPISIVLFDEIEKANDSLWNLLLGILDNAIVTLGSNVEVSFSDTMVFMTSNVGGEEISNVLRTGELGFHHETNEDSVKAIQKRFESLDIMEYAQQTFSPEFLNRISKIIKFAPLTREALDAILTMEVEKVFTQLLVNKNFHLMPKLSPGAREFLLNEGYSPVFGARYLKRTLKKHIVNPLSNLISTEQVNSGDTVYITVKRGKGSGLKFSRPKAAKNGMS